MTEALTLPKSVAVPGSVSNRSPLGDGRCRASRRVSNLVGDVLRVRRGELTSSKELLSFRCYRWAQELTSSDQFYQSRPGVLKISNHDVNEVILWLRISTSLLESIVPSFLPGFFSEVGLQEKVTESLTRATQPGPLSPDCGKREQWRGLYLTGKVFTI